MVYEGEGSQWSIRGTRLGDARDILYPEMTDLPVAAGGNPPATNLVRNASAAVTG